MEGWARGSSHPSPWGKESTCQALASGPFLCNVSLGGLSFLLPVFVHNDLFCSCF